MVFIQTIWKAAFLKMIKFIWSIFKIISTNISAIISQIKALNNKNIVGNLNKCAFPKNKIFQIRYSKNVSHDDKLIN